MMKQLVIATKVFHVNDAATACEEDTPICTTHDKEICFDDDIYWADSCGTKEDLKGDCPTNSGCQEYEGTFGCYCKDGFHIEDGACISDVVIPDVCEGITCTTWYPNSVCIEYNGEAACDCQEGYHWSGDECIL
jgi:hypothetical protein